MTGARFRTESRAVIDVISGNFDFTGDGIPDGNVFLMSGGNGTGLRFDLGGDPSEVNIQSNTILESLDSGTGILFTPTSSPLLAIIENNIIETTVKQLHNN